MNPKYDLIRSKGEIKYFVDYLKDCKLILDAGCGNNWFRNWTKSKVIGIDNDILSEADVIANVFEIPFKKDSFDGLICFEVLEHLHVDKAEKMFSEFWRVLKPNGKIILTTPTPEYKKFWSSDDTHVRPYSKEEIKKLMKKFSIKIEKAFCGNVLSAAVGRFLHWKLAKILPFRSEDYIIIGRK